VVVVDRARGDDARVATTVHRHSCRDRHPVSAVVRAHTGEPRRRARAHRGRDGGDADALARRGAGRRGASRVRCVARIAREHRAGGDCERCGRGTGDDDDEDERAGRGQGARA